jgi:hypothetical protein
MAESTTSASEEPKKKETVKPEEFTIEELAERLKVPKWVLKGMMVAYNWGTGKSLTEKDFISKRDSWLNGPMCRS